jgi:hypothetical protein
LRLLKTRRKRDGVEIKWLNIKRLCQQPGKGKQRERGREGGREREEERELNCDKSNKNVL